MGGKEANVSALLQDIKRPVPEERLEQRLPSSQLRLSGTDSCPIECPFILLAQLLFGDYVSTDKSLRQRVL
jgi:hypothetical protein